MRTCACATRSLWTRCRRGLPALSARKGSISPPRTLRRRCSPRSASGTWCRQPRRGFADEHVFGRAWGARRRFPSRSSRPSGHGRRRPGVRGDDRGSEQGRITPGCPGIYNDQQVAAWRRISNFVHRESKAKFCLQLGHSGAKARPGAAGRAWITRSRTAIGRSSPLRRSLSTISCICRGRSRAPTWSVSLPIMHGRGQRRQGRFRHDRSARRSWLSALRLYFAAEQSAHR